MTTSILHAIDSRSDPSRLPRRPAQMRCPAARIPDKLIPACILASSLLVSACGQAGVADGPHDPELRKEVACKAHGGFSGRVCETSIIRLISDPSPYYGKLVFVSGYSVEQPLGRYLYANRPFHEASDIMSSIEVTGEFEAESGTQLVVIGRRSEASSPSFYSPAPVIDVQAVR